MVMKLAEKAMYTATEFKEYQSKLQEVRQNTTWLQGIGAVYGKPAGELQPGDFVVWNYGSSSKVLQIVKQTAATITVEFAADERYNKTHQRTFKKNRIVALRVDGKLRIANVTKSEVS